MVWFETKKGPILCPKQQMGPSLRNLTLDYDDQREPKTRRHRIDQVICSVDKIDIDIIGVAPTYRPRSAKTKPIAAVLKARLASHDNGMADMERMFTAKVRMELGVGDAAVLDGAVLHGGFGFCSSGRFRHRFCFMRISGLFRCVGVLGRLGFFGRRL